MRALLALAIALPSVARADAITKSTSSDDDVHLVGDVRMLIYDRDDNNYFRDASRFNYSMSSAALGIMGTLGVQVSPRLALAGEAFYALDGADRGDARLRLASGALVGVARFSLAHLHENQVDADISALGGFGRYYIKETFVDPGLSPMVYSTSAGSFGGLGGVEASISASSFRAVICYAYHYAPATIDDRIRGSVDAGGHAVSLGIGVRL
jgi:hypothetical protein